MKKISYTKMHGLGNDFLILDCLKRNISVPDLSKFTQSICNRRTGVGTDGIILILPSKKQDFRMRIINSDGSEAEMCGNGFRCLIRYLYDQKLTRKKKITVETLAGPIIGEIVSKNKSGFKVKVCMGTPSFDTDDIPMKTRTDEFINLPLKIGTKSYKVTALSMGNPHAVIFVKKINFDWQSIGSKIENHRYFPQRTNVEFVIIKSARSIVLKSWERGAGPTLASGTGACASVMAGIKNGWLNNKVKVQCELGSLYIEYYKSDTTIYKSGPAEFISEGTYYY